MAKGSFIISFYNIHISDQTMFPFIGIHLLLAKPGAGAGFASPHGTLGFVHDIPVVTTLAFLTGRAGVTGGTLAGLKSGPGHGESGVLGDGIVKHYFSVIKRKTYFSTKQLGHSKDVFILFIRPI